MPDSVPEAMLRPYPELWRQWQDERNVPWEEDGHDAPGSDLERRLHSPIYLRAVIREYEHLRQGGDQPDPALAARCEAIVAARPEIAEFRRRRLNDPWWRALTGGMLGYTPEGVADLYDPDHLKGMVDYANRLDDPFSREGIEDRRKVADWIAFAAPSAKAADAPYN